MPRYDYRCETCGAELELTHGMTATVERAEHPHAESGAPCDGPLERLIALVGVNQSGVSKPLTDGQIERAGFTKYVRGAKGYEKAAGPPGAPSFIPRE